MKNNRILIILMSGILLVVSLPIANSILFGDTNSDNKVNILDLAIIGKSFGSTPQDKNWNSQADVNKDNKVNILDLATVGKNFDKSYCLSKTYCLTEEDLALSREEQMKKFGIVVNPSKDVQASSSTVAASSIPYQQGWPQATGNNIGSSPTLADLDGDDKLEVIVGSYDWKIYVWHYDGTPLQGWPIQIDGAIFSSAAVGDIDGDGNLEVVVGSFDNNVYAWHHNGTLVQGWPQTTGYWVKSSPALADIDRDGKLEIIIGSDDGRVYAWHYDGTPVSGWPQQTGDIVFSSPAVGDIDNDGDLEIVVGSGLYDKGVYAWHANGTLVAGWPQKTGGGVYSSPALGDIDNDGDLEIVVGSEDNCIYAWHHNGSFVAGWNVCSKNDIVSSPALGDIDGDGDLEVVVGTYYSDVVALHHDGTIVTGWPVMTTPGKFIASSPALGDIDGDGDTEVVVGSRDKNLYAWHADGALVNVFPLGTGDDIGFSSPALGDIDNDGDLEIAIGSMDHNVYVWDLPGAYNTKNIPWPMFRHDLRHTGRYTQPQTFLDVPWFYWSFDEIDKIAKAGITKGCKELSSGQLLFCPKQNVTRSQMASFLVRAFNITPYNNSNQTFVDVPKTYWNYADIEAFYLQNITKGCVLNATGLYYCPDRNVRRDEMASFLVRAFQINPLNNSVPTFVDVPKTWWNYADVEAFYLQNITKGCMINSTGTYYCPSQTVTREQMAVFLARAFKLV